MRLYRNVVGIALTLLPLVAGLGCTGSKVLTPGNGQLVLQVSMEPPAGQREGSKPPFLWAKAEMAAVTFRPVDPNTSVSLSSDPLQFLAQPTAVDMTASGPQQVTAVTVNAGTYQVEGILVNGFELNTVNESPLLANNLCTIVNIGTPEVPDYVLGDLDVATIAVAGSGQERRIVPATRPVFEVRPGAPTTLRIVMNGATLTSILESRVTCQVGSRLATVNPVPAADITSSFSFQLP